MQNKDYTIFPSPDSDPLEKTVYTELDRWKEETQYVDFAYINNVPTPPVDPAIERMQRFQEQEKLRPKIKFADTREEMSILFAERVKKEPKKPRFSLRHNTDKESSQHYNTSKEDGFRHRLSVRLGIKKGERE